MEDAAQTDAYAAADLSALQQAMVDAFVARFGPLNGGCLLDLGCGAADMSIRFATAFPEIAAVGIDGSAPFLERGAEAIAAAGLRDRIRLEQRFLPDAALETRAFDAVIANSLLHHLSQPDAFWRSVVRCARSGAPVMVMDLRRPVDADAALRLVDWHAAEAQPVLRRDFFNSLCAAYRADEIREQLDRSGLTAFQVEDFGDVHLLAWGIAP